MPGIKLDSPAWLLRGISSLPGHLHLRDGWLWLQLHDDGNAWGWQLRKLGQLAADPDLGERLQLGQGALLFRERLEQLVIGSPWYYFMGGLVVTTARARWRIGFAPPVGPIGNQGLTNAARNLRSAWDARQTGRRWLQALARAATPPV